MPGCRLRHMARRVLFRIAIFGRARPCEHLPQHLDPIVGRLGKGSPNGGQHSAGLVAALEGAERFALPPPPAIASVGPRNRWFADSSPWREMDSNFRYRAKGATDLSFRFCLCPLEPKVRIPVPSKAVIGWSAL